MICPPFSIGIVLSDAAEDEEAQDRGEDKEDDGDGAGTAIVVRADNAS